MEHALALADTHEDECIILKQIHWAECLLELWNNPYEVNISALVLYFTK